MIPDTPKKAPQRFWTASREQIQDFLEDCLPAAVVGIGEEVVSYYCKTLLPAIKEAFLQEVSFYDETESFSAWLYPLVQRTVDQSLAPVVKEGYLADEELVRLERAGLESAKIYLIHRWLPKIKGFVSSTVHAHNVSPSSTDVIAFIEDVSQEVGLRLVERLGQFEFEQPFEHWVKSICYNTAYELRRPIARRFRAGAVEYVSWEELDLPGVVPILQDATHQRIVRELLDEHGKKGGRAEKSRDAIELSYYHDMSHKAIAKKLGTSPGYVDQLFSHDYRKLRQRCREKFGLSGTDL